MRKIFLSALGLTAAAAALLGGRPATAQVYSNAVMTLNPVGYWPLNENAAPPQPLNLTAVNYGTLGAAGNGYYGAWYQPSGNTWYLTNNIVQANAFTYPYDGSKGMVCQGQPGQYVIVPRNTNGVNNAGVTLNPPFSIEAWLKIGTTASALGDIISQGGTVNLNTGGPNTNNPYYGGLGTGWAGVELGQYQDYIFLLTQSTNAAGNKNSELDTSGYNKHQGFQIGQWVHVVATFDGTTEAIYTNGVLCVSKTSPANAIGQRFVVDPTSPLMIGGGSDVTASYGQGFQGTIDDVAIYNSALSLSSIQAHYSAANGDFSSFNSYTNAVLADSPVLYYRLNDPQTQVSAGYPSGSFPVATNYGSAGAAANGVYQPGTTPGVAGPAYAGFGAGSAAVAFNGWLGGVDVGGGNLPSSLNPTSTAPLTVVAWFQGGPADSPGRYQEILGHGDSSYRLGLGQTAADNHFNPGPGPDLLFTNTAEVANNGFAVNDGNWHMVAGVCDGTNESMYVDGVLAKTTNVVAGVNIAGNARDLLIGGDSQYTTASFGSANTIRTFDGQVAQVAFWTNALSASQIQGLFTAAGVAPYIWRQPVASVVTNALRNLTVSAGVRGSAPIAYQWYQNGSPVSGQTNMSLAFTPIATGNAGNYYLVATNLTGSATSSVVNIVVYGPPTVTAQSDTQMNIFAGAQPTLRVSAVGAAPIVYQWTSNNVPIAGATNSSVTVSNLQVGASTYDCFLTNAVGSASISPIAMTVLANPTAPFPLIVLADKAADYFRLDEADTGYPNDGVVAYDYAGGNNGTYSNTALGQVGYSANTDPTETSAGFATSASENSYMGDVSPLLSFAQPNGSNAEFSVEAWVAPSSGQVYDAGLVTIGYGYGGEQFAIDCGANDTSPSLAHSVRFYINTATGKNYGVNSTFVMDPYVNPGWHHIVAVCDEAGGHIYLYIDGVLQGTTAVPSGLGLQGETAPLAIGSRLSTASATGYDNQFYGNIDDVALYNYPLSAAQVQNHYLQSGVAPVITGLLPSSNWTTNQAANVTFTVSATGTAPLAYQWLDNNNNPIPGGTNATLVLSNVQPSQAGTYTVNITNLYGGPVYTNVNLMVTQVPQLVTDITPSNLTVYATTPVTLSVTIAGTPPLHYQWYQDGAAVPNQTNTTYSFAALSGTHTYYLSVTNQYSAGSPTLSSTATVVGMPATTLNPADYTDHLKITFSGYNRGETLSDFPALVRLSAGVNGFNYSHFASPTGGDLRFTDASGTREIPFEIDQWNPGGESTVWVQVPALSGTNTTVWAYWGDPSAAAPLPGTNVWVPQPWEGLPAYDIVYHLKEGALPFADSTGQYPALTGVAPAQAAGVVGTGGGFDGSTDFLDAGVVSVGKQFTASAWINIAPSAVSEQTMWANKVGGWNANGFDFYVNSWAASDGVIYFDTADGVNGSVSQRSAPNAVSFGQWHLLTGTLDGSNGVVRVYVDGVDQTTSTAVDTSFQSTNYVRLGALLTGSPGTSGLGGTYFDGTMDEARIHAGIESTNWIWASWMTVAQTAGLETNAGVVSTVTNSTPVTIQVQYTAGSGGAAGSLVLSGMGGQAGGTYYVVGTTNLALPMSQWTVLSTNAFDSSGDFNVTVPVDATKKAQFVRIKQ